MGYTPTTNPKTYFSYFNAVNPMPCAEVLFGEFYSFLASEFSLPGTFATMGLWAPDETYLECSDSYLASLTAYWDIFIASPLVSQHPAFNLGSNMTMVDRTTYTLWFYGFWGLWWIHSSFPN